MPPRTRQTQSPTRFTTIHGYQTGEIVSWLQKAVRRGLEEDALFCAFELHNSGFGAWAFKRLHIICSEDIGPAWPEGPAVLYALRQSYADATKGGKRFQGEGMFLAHAVIALVRAPKSGIARSACGVFANLDEEGELPEVPDYALDQHTAAGKRMGRGVDHFYEEGIKLDVVGVEDIYQERAHAIAKKNGGRRRPRGRVDEDNPDQFELEV